MNREKKQLLVVGVLVALILCVGAFQFMRGGEAPPPAATKKPEDKPAAGKPEAVKPLNEGLPMLAAKDPFMPAPFISEGTTPPVNPTPTPTPTPKPSGNHNGGRFRPGGLPPDLEDPRNWIGNEGSKKEVPPVEPPKPVFGYNLVGIVNGEHPMAVFEDASGNQQLVEVGQAIGSSATLTHISRGSVRVKFNAETLVFSVGGNPNAK